MARTRKAKIDADKMTEIELIDMVKKSTLNGFPVPQQILIDLTSFGTVAKLNDSGVITMQTTAHGAMFTAS